MQDFYKVTIIYYIFFFCFFMLGGNIKSKKQFWMTITPLAIIIYPIIWLIEWYKELK